MEHRGSATGPGSPGPAGPGSPLAALRRHWLIALIAAVALVVLGLRFLRRPAAEDAEPPAVVTAQTAPARVGVFEVTTSALGTVQPRPGAFAQLAAPAASRVTRILVAIGDRVKAGQALIRLDESVWVLQARQAQVALDGARQGYDRARRLFDEGISPQKDVETAAAELARARAELEAAQRTETLATLRSPIAGVVTELNASLGAPVSEAQPLVEVIDPAGLEVLFHLSPEAAARVSPGAAVEVSTLRDSVRAFLGRGTITGVSAAIDSASGAVIVRATVASPAEPLRAGETVAGRLVVARHPGAVIVPTAALVPEGDAFRVFVVDAQSIAHATPVTVGGRDDREAEILSGLHGGETVVTEGAYGVTDGARIRVPAAPGADTGHAG